MWDSLSNFIAGMALLACVFGMFILYAIFEGLRSAPGKARMMLERWNGEEERKHKEARKEIDKELEILFPEKGKAVAEQSAKGVNNTAEAEVKEVAAEEEGDEYTHIILEDVDA